MPEVKLITNTKVAAPDLPVSLTKDQLALLEVFAFSHMMTEDEKMEALDEAYTAETKKTVVDARRKKTAK